MKIAAISDLHGELIDIPACDVLCISGDIIPLGIQRDYELSEKWFLKEFCDWLIRLPCEKVIFTAGNHDFYLRHISKSPNEYVRFKDQLSKNTDCKAILIIDEYYDYKGTLFYGFPWIEPILFQKGRWAFEAKKNNYVVLHDVKADILLTHDCPLHNSLLGYTISKMEYKPKYVFYGHWHEGISDIQRGWYNCSILNDMYTRNNKEIPIVEIPMEYDVINFLLEQLTVYAKVRGLTEEQVNMIKEYLLIQRDFYNQPKEDEIPLPVTGDAIDGEDEN